MDSDGVLEHDRAERRARRRTIFSGTGITATTTGSGRLFSTLDHYLVASQISSFGTAFITVFAVIFVIFRSLRFGFLTIAPNLLPVLAVLGVMGFLGISLNIATVMVASVALGVVDDDTIHFINRYRREVAAGAGTDEAIEIATVHEGRASLTTALINSLAFGVLLFSEYKPTAWFGGLLGLTMVVAFLAEVFILPATIKLLPRLFGAEALRRTGRNLWPPETAHGCCTKITKITMVTKSSSEQIVVRGSSWSLWPLWLAVAVIGAASPVQAQPAPPTGYVSVFLDHLPNRDATELRARGFAEAEDRRRVAPAPDGVRLRRGAARGSRAGGSRDAIAEPQELNADVSREAVRSLGRPGARRVGAPRRAAADRRDQSDRRLAILLRRTERGAAAGAARPRARVRRRQGVDRRHLRAVLPARPLRSPRRAPRRRST